jgi:hypothetical protein
MMIRTGFTGKVCACAAVAIASTAKMAVLEKQVEFINALLARRSIAGGPAKRIQN